MVLLCATGFPFLVEAGFAPNGAGADELTMELFVAGGFVVVLLFLFVAVVSWTHR